MEVDWKRTTGRRNIVIISTDSEEMDTHVSCGDALSCGLDYTAVLLGLLGLQSTN